MIRKKPVSFDAAQLRMADICARAEHCRYEIAEKLRRMRLPLSDIQKIISFLEDNRYIDEERYAAAFAHDKVRFSGWGKNKIRVALIQKRIPSRIITQALEDIDEQEYSEALSRVAANRAEGLHLSEAADRNRLFRYLASRGFESDPIARIIRLLREKEGNDE